MDDGAPMMVILPIEGNPAEGFHSCLDLVAKEKKYPALQEAPPIGSARVLLKSDIKRAFSSGMESGLMVSAGPGRRSPRLLGPGAVPIPSCFRKPAFPGADLPLPVRRSIFSDRERRVWWTGASE